MIFTNLESICHKPGGKLPPTIVKVEGTPTMLMAKMVKAYCDEELKGFEFLDYDDPAGTRDNYVNREETSYKVMGLEGIKPIHPVSASMPNRRLNGVALIQFLISQAVESAPFIRVHEQCRTLIKALEGGYRYKTDSKTGYPTDQIQEEHPYEDVIDCMRMTLMETCNIVRLNEFFGTNFKYDKVTGQPIRG
jgi:hypothetical protein